MRSPTLMAIANGEYQCLLTVGTNVASSIVLPLLDHGPSSEELTIVFVMQVQKAFSAIFGVWLMGRECIQYEGAVKRAGDTNVNSRHQKSSRTKA